MNSAYKVKGLLSALTVVLLAAAPLARAQDSSASSAPSAAASANDMPPPPPDDAAPMPKKGKKGMMDPVSQVTGLTDDQKTQIKALQQAGREKAKAVPDDDNKRAALRQIMMDTGKQIRALLNDDQKGQYDAAVKKMMRRKRKADDGDAGAPPPPPADAPAAPSSAM